MRRSTFAIMPLLMVVSLLSEPRVASADDRSVLQNLYGYWDLHTSTNTAWAGKIRDDGTLLHPALYQYPANSELGQDLQPVRVPGILGEGLLLQGKQKPFVMDVPLPAGSPRRLTISMWAWMEERSDDATLFSNTALSNFGYGQFRFKALADGITVIFGEFNPGDETERFGPREVMSTKTPFPLKQWQHIVLVIDEPEARLYLNGKEIGTIHLKQPLQVSVIETVTFGAYRRRWSDVTEKGSQGNQFQPWTGRMDEIAMWTRPLSAAEVRGLYAATLAGKPVYEATPVFTMWESQAFRISLGAVGSIIVGLLVHRWFTKRLRRRLTIAESLLLVDSERKRIADDIHDELGAQLAKLSLLTELAAQENPLPERLLGLSDTARNASRSLDELVWTLKPSHDSLNDFINYIADIASELLDGTSIALRLDIPEQVPAIRIPPTARREMLLVCKESLTNMLKHSQATEVGIRLAVSSHEISLTIADNGIGLPHPSERPTRRNGMRIMAERMTRVGGTCTVDGNEPRGTRVVVALPFGGAT